MFSQDRSFSWYQATDPDHYSLRKLKAPPNATSPNTKGKIHSKGKLYSYKQEPFDDSKHLNVEWMDLLCLFSTSVFSGENNLQVVSGLGKIVGS